MSVGCDSLEYLLVRAALSANPLCPFESIESRSKLARRTPGPNLDRLLRNVSWYGMAEYATCILLTRPSSRTPRTPHAVPS